MRTTPLKSYVEELTQVYRALFKDALYAFPAIADELVKDQARLMRHVEANGIVAFVTDLPSAGKAFDRSLSAGEYNGDGQPFTGCTKLVKVPKFLRGLFLLVFDVDGRLKEDCDVQAIFFIRQLYAVAKKTSLRCGADKVLAEVESFISVDKEMPMPEKFWAEAGPSAEGMLQTYRGFSESLRYIQRAHSLSSDFAAMSTLLGNLDVVSRLLSESLGVYDPDEHRFNHGPGVVSNLETRWANKFAFTNWSDRLEHVFPIARYGFHSYSSWADFVVNGKREISSIEPLSRLIDVPKTYSKPRLIAAESSEQMWCQQNIKAHMYSRVEQSWVGAFVKFDDQTLNQELCMRGSLDGSLATIDLSAASDRVSCHAVGQFFRSNWSVLRALQATRTRALSWRPEGSPEVTCVELNKYSTMGNATTFPVETLIFLGVTLAACLTARKLKPTLKNVLALQGEVSIFGDDIIVPEDCRVLLVEALGVLDFKVNADKSFWEGNFRESCGIDSFRGCDVTPAYWKAPIDRRPGSLSKAIDTANNFYSRLLCHVVAVLDKAIEREYKNLPLIPYDSGVSGRKSFVSPKLCPLPRRYNEKLQRIEYLMDTVTGVPKEATPATDDTGLMRFLSAVPRPFSQRDAGTPRAPDLKMRSKWVPEFELVSSTPAEPGYSLCMPAELLRTGFLRRYHVGTRA